MSLQKHIEKVSPPARGNIDIDILEVNSWQRFVFKHLPTIRLYTIGIDLYKFSLRVYTNGIDLYKLTLRLYTIGIDLYKFTLRLYTNDIDLYKFTLSLYTNGIDLYKFSHSPSLCCRWC